MHASKMRNAREDKAVSEYQKRETNLAVEMMFQREPWQEP
jgi:hypothetical protein